MALFNEFDQYLEKSISDRFFKHADVQALLQKLDKNLFGLREIGMSSQGRSISLVTVGTGEIKILLWSQMHGDEPTATMALFDLLNYLSSNDADLSEQILTNCTLYIIPMLNPDGAEVFTRRNAQGLDINRDFNSQQTPEGMLLRQIRDEIQPDFAFNLHDQGSVWSAGNTGNPAAISLLAPPFDASVSTNKVRKKAMQVVSCIHKKLQTVMPGYVGRWTDEYEARAFGDGFQAAGTSTILIESGNLKNDFEKQIVRRLTLSAILSGLAAIATNSFVNEGDEAYRAIPDNEKRHFNILLRNCNIEGYVVDVGLIADEIINEDLTSVRYNYLVEDIGDLSGFYGYSELDATGYTTSLAKPLVVGKLATISLAHEHEAVLIIEVGRIEFMDSLKF